MKLASPQDKYGIPETHYTSMNPEGNEAKSLCKAKKVLGYGIRLQYLHNIVMITQ